MCKYYSEHGVYHLKISIFCHKKRIWNSCRNEMVTNKNIKVMEEDEDLLQASVVQQ